MVAWRHQPHRPLANAAQKLLSFFKRRRVLLSEDERQARKQSLVDRLSVAFTGLSFVLLGLWLFWLAQGATPFRHEIYFAIGHACLVVGLFSIIIELPQITRYIANELGKIIYGREYLKRHSYQLKQIRKTIDEVDFGEAELLYRGSLYGFIDKNVHQYYVSNYRREYLENVEIRYQDKDYVVFRARTEYVLAKNRARGAPADTLVVRFGNAQSDLSGPITIHDVLIKLSVGLGEHVFLLDDKKAQLRCRHEGCGPVILEQQSDDPNRLSYGFEIRVPEDAVSDGEVQVSIDEMTRQQRRASVYSIRMSDPTQNFTLTCSSPDDMRLEPSSFDLSTVVENSEAYGHIVLAIRDWLLPGHGVSLVWIPDDKATDHVEPKTSSSAPGGGGT